MRGLDIYFGWSILQWAVVTSATLNCSQTLVCFVLKFWYDGCSRKTWEIKECRPRRCVCCGVADTPFRFV
jgi:hypothetical protein